MLTKHSTMTYVYEAEQRALAQSDKWTSSMYFVFCFDIAFTNEPPTSASPYEFDKPLAHSIEITLLRIFKIQLKTIKSSSRFSVCTRACMHIHTHTNTH